MGRFDIRFLVLLVASLSALGCAGSGSLGGRDAEASDGSALDGALTAPSTAPSTVPPSTVPSTLARWTARWMRGRPVTAA